MPTKGDGFHHDPHRERIEKGGSDKGKGKGKAGVFPRQSQQNFHFAMIASNIENAFGAMR